MMFPANKPKIFYQPLDEHRQWVVQFVNSVHYFATYQLALDYVKQMIPKSG